jgi:signal transduction histidine kinase
VLKHAEATNIFIDLVAEPGMIELSVFDDGKGFDREQIKTKKGVGLKNIANRVELVNGKIRVESTPGEGCKLRISIPV